MPVDLSLANRAGINAFARPMLVMPLASNPASGMYLARAVLTIRPDDITLENGAILASRSTTLGIETSEFAILPAPGDQVSYDNGATWYWVEDLDPDSATGMSLVLKAVEP
jgi:hypothetical protein